MACFGQMFAAMEAKERLLGQEPQSCRPCGVGLSGPARPVNLTTEDAAAARPPACLPPALWEQVWGGLDKAFFPTGGHPAVNMGGACKCGKLKFQTDGTLTASFWCHCHMCRRYWSQACPTETLWISPATAVSVVSGAEHVKSWTVDKLSRNLRGQANVNFCGSCGTPINVEFSDPNATFTLMWPKNFTADEWGDTSGKGDKSRHGFFEMFQPRFHAHYENRACDFEDSLPKLADIWLEGLPTMNNKGEVIGKVEYPMKGFENGWMNAPTENSVNAPAPLAITEAGDTTMQQELVTAMADGKLTADLAADFFVAYEAKKMRARL